MNFYSLSRELIYVERIFMAGVSGRCYYVVIKMCCCCYRVTSYGGADRRDFFLTLSNMNFFWVKAYFCYVLITSLGCFLMILEATFKHIF